MKVIMAVTVLLFKDTPFEEDILENLSVYLSNVQLFDGQPVRGELTHCTFHIKDQPSDVYGYVLNLNDEVLHTPNLWMIYLGAGDSGHHKFQRMGNLLSASTKYDLLNAYMSGPNAVIEYKGGASSLRHNLAESNRKGFGLVE